MEFFNGTQWKSCGTVFTVITDQQFNGDGTTTGFTLTASTTTAASVVSINGVVQIPTLAYSVTGVTLTFTEAPLAGDVIDVRVLTTTESGGSGGGTASANGYVQLSVDNNGLYIYTGSAGTTAITTSWNTAGARVGSIANTAIATANTATTIDSMDSTTYRSAKYVIQATNGANYQVMEALLISNGTTATVMTYGTIQTGANVGVVSATQSGSNAQLQFVSTSAGTNVRITKDYMVI
jgi:hypothetical protein